ncbi:MAG: cyclophilin-like fold protein [Thermodesulfobacteriota bacterium]
MIIELPGLSTKAVLNSTRSAEALWRSLPITGQGRLWGKELYFMVELKLPTDELRLVVEKGDLAYWPAGPALCIFFGPTPASQGNECRAASPVEVLGRIVASPAELEKIKEGPVSLHLG